MGDFTDLTRVSRAAGLAGAATLGINPLHALFASEPGHVSPYSPSSRNQLDYLYIDPCAVEGYVDAAEPYPKSLAKELYRKSIQVDFDVEADSDAVIFRPFVGISPNRYLDFFSMVTRKDEQGHTLGWSPEVAQPRIERIGTYEDAEAGLMDELAESRPRLSIKRSDQQEGADGEAELA